ncbi:YebC/PmpR family DNA-binding transcriptional regulator [Patescibacteria group bacterium]|nr:YebC/PmpR family DNA-binding transcriptional regulator [Patescibacteria group bacterium]
MSGHSKWHSIRHKKAATDAKRGKIFSKLIKNVTVAAREGGGDPVINFRLRLAIDKAKAANVPKDNIERAIARGTGEVGEGALETVVYEGMGPGGASLIIEAVTDNKNRTHASIKIIFNKQGGNMEAKVMWQFDRKGVVRVHDVSSVEDRDSLELSLIDAGTEDITWNEKSLEVVSAINDLQKVEEAVKSAGLTVESADLEYIAKDEIKLSEEDEAKLEKFIELLDDDDDVTNVYTNAS